MTDEPMAEAVATAASRRRRFDSNWIRIEGIVGAGALLTSFIWFLGMPTGMAIGVGFGIVLLLDVIRALLFGPSQPDQSDRRPADSVRGGT